MYRNGRYLYTYVLLDELETIAVIEDNVLTGDMITDILVGEGFQVIRAYSGTEALYLLKQKKPDLM